MLEFARKAVCGKLEAKSPAPSTKSKKENEFPSFFFFCEIFGKIVGLFEFIKAPGSLDHLRGWGVPGI